MGILEQMNIFIGVWFGLWVIPHAIRDQASGEFTGYRGARVYLYFLILGCVHAIAVLAAEPLGVAAIIKIVMLTLVPFVAAWFMVRYFYAKLER